MGTLFYDFERVIQDTQPKVFIFGNVAGILNHDKKGHGKKLMKCLNPSIINVSVKF